MPQHDDKPDVAYTTTLDVTPNGARIVIWAGNQAELAQIHRTLSKHAAIMRDGSCPESLSAAL